MDWSSLIPWVCSSLNAGSTADLTAWTEAELYNYAEEALHDVGGRYVLFADRDDSITLGSSASYSLPALHIATVYAAAAGEALKPSSVAEVEALNEAWQTAAAGTPTRWIGNALGTTLIWIYPPASPAKTLNLIYHKHPPDLTAGAPTVAMPAPIGDYLVLRTLQAARDRMGDMQMPDAAKAFGGVAQIYEAAMAAYWG